MTDQEKIDRIFEAADRLHKIAYEIVLIISSVESTKLFSVECVDELLKLSQLVVRLRAMIIEGRAFVSGTKLQSEVYRPD